MATSLEIAKDLRAQAATLIEAANILDPPKPKQRRRTKGNGRKRVMDSSEALREAVRIDLGTAGRTSHPNDPDAKALAESLVHTTEAPKGYPGERY